MRLLFWRPAGPDFDAMTDEQFEEWRENFRFKINLQLAQYNYFRSDEWKPIKAKYDKLTRTISFSTLIILLVAAQIAGYDLNGGPTTYAVFGLTLVAGLLAALYARNKYRPPSIIYIAENYWPTNDGDPKTDAGAVAGLPETIGDRFWQALYVIF
jgi:hypothetical protein